MFKIIEQKLFSRTGEIYVMADLSIDQSNCSPGFLNFELDSEDTLKMASTRAVERSVANKSFSGLQTD